MTHTPLPTLGFLAPLRIAGSDAPAFLQGQLSADVAQLPPGICQLASLNSAQGRVQAVLTLVGDEDGYLALVPVTMIEAVAARLRKYILRSKVTLTDLRDTLPITAASREDLIRAGLPVPERPAACSTGERVRVLRWHEPGSGLPPRFLILGGSQATAPDPAVNAHWRLAEIRAGLPQVLPETHEAFVAQMLNLDLLGGIAFDKGCYTGQEIVARTHYRGAIKRRMFRFAAACPPPAPGTRVLAAGTHAGDIVDAAPTPAGCELLAVVTLAAREAALELAGEPGVALEPRPLPYDVKPEA